MANELLRTATGESAARLYQSIGEPNVAGHILIREWPEIDASVADTLLVTLNGVTSYTNPQADQQAYTGTYYHSKTVAIEDGKSFVTLRQYLCKIATITTSSDLPTPEILRGQEVLDAFSLEEGTHDYLGYRYKYLNPANSAAIQALSISAPSGYAEKKRETSVDGDTKTLTLDILYRLVTWRQWGKTLAGGTSTAADTTEYDNAGTDNEKEIITKTWAGVRTADIATAIAAIRTGSTGYAAETGYIIVQSTVKDNHDGSITLRQVQIKQVSSKSVKVKVVGERYINPMGFYPGKIDTSMTIYDDFTAAGLTSAVVGETAPDASWTADHYATELKSQGLYRRVYLWVKATWPNTTPTFKKMSIDGADSPNAMYHRETHVAYGVPLSSVESKVEDASTGTDEYLVESVDGTDEGNGGAKITQRRKVINTATGEDDYIIISREVSLGGDVMGVTRMWPTVTQEEAETLCEPGGYAYIEPPTTVLIDSIAMIHVSNHKEILQPSGLVNVIEVLKRAGATFEIRAHPDQDETYAKQDYVQMGPENSKVWYRLTYGVKLCTSSSEAKTYCDAGTVIPGSDSKARLGGYEYQPATKTWLATKVTIDVGTDGKFTG